MQLSLVIPRLFMGGQMQLSLVIPRLLWGTDAAEPGYSKVIYGGTDAAEPGDLGEVDSKVISGGQKQLRLGAWKRLIPSLLVGDRSS